MLEIFKKIAQSDLKPEIQEAVSTPLAFDRDLERLFRSWWRYLDETRSRERNVTGPMHLVSLDRPIHAVARRAITFSNPELINDLTCFSIVSHYHDALLQLCDRVYAAIQAGKLTPRDDLLGYPITFLQAPAFESWRRLCRAVQRGEKEIAIEALSKPLAVSTDSIFPSVLVDVAEFSRWAESEGIAAAGEIKRLLSNEGSGYASSHKNRSETNQQSSAFATTKDTWKTKARHLADEIYRHDKASGCDPSKSAIAAEVAKRFNKEGICGKRGGRLDGETILRHALCDWQKPK